MKKILFLISICVNIFSYEIDMQQSFTKEIKPKELGVAISISTKAKDLDDVLNRLNDYSAFIKSYKTQGFFISGGRFDTFPNYVYKHSQRVKVGYRGNMRFEIKSKNSKRLNNFISQLTAKNSLNDVDLSISSLDWKVSQNDIKKAKESLRLEAIHWAKEYAQKLSNDTNEQCFIKKIDFGSINYTQPVYRGMVEEVPIPIKNKQKYKINANFVFECK